MGEVPWGKIDWQGNVRVAGSRFTDWQPCWITRGQSAPKLDGDHAEFAMVSEQVTANDRKQNGIGLEFEASPAAQVELSLNGQRLCESATTLGQSSRILWWRDDNIRRLETLTGLTPADVERGDVVYYLTANKAKIHRPIPQAGYTASMSLVDDEPLDGETHYRVRVEQRNGQRAWSSPIWIGNRK